MSGAAAERGGKGAGNKGGGRGGGGGGRGGGRGGYGPARGGGDGGRAAWDEAQQRSLKEKAFADVDLTRKRPQCTVEAFPHLTVAADWPERKAPRSGSAFYLPLIWTALLLELVDSLEELGEMEATAIAGSALVQLAMLGDEKHFHNGDVRRATVADLRAAQSFWTQVFSGWSDWARRLCVAMNAYVGEDGSEGREALVAAYVQRTSVSACALVYGNLGALGALPHISNANRAPHQDAILELDLGLRCEIEASIATLYRPDPSRLASARTPGTTAAAPQQDRWKDGAGAAASATAVAGAAKVDAQPSRAAATVASPSDGPSGAASGATPEEKEIMKLRKKLREIAKLKERPREELETLQLKKLETESETQAKLAELERLAA